MKTIWVISLVSFLGIVSCKQQGDYTGGDSDNPKTLPHDTDEDTSHVKKVSFETNFGDKIDKEGAVPAHTLPALMGKQDSLNIKLRGKVVEVCPKKGCWMTIDLKNGELMRVTFRNYGFFIPQSAEGNHVVIKGTAKTDTTMVSTLRHYARDAGQSAKAIAAIKSPKTELVFVADGVVLEKEDESDPKR